MISEAIELPIFVKGLGYEGCDEWIQTSKMMGKTVSNKERISGDFMINVRKITK